MRTIKTFRELKNINKEQKLKLRLAPLDKETTKKEANTKLSGKARANAHGTSTECLRLP